MMLAGLPVPDNAVEGIAETVRAAGAEDRAERLERGVADGVKLLALTLDERAVLLVADWGGSLPSGPAPTPFAYPRAPPRS